MSSRIIRRLSQLCSSTSDWLSEMALKTCGCLREILDTRLEQLSARPSLFRNPSQEHLVKDAQALLLHSGDYTQSVLTNPGQKVGLPFIPGTLFLTSHGLQPEILIDYIILGLSDTVLES